MGIDILEGIPFAVGGVIISLAMGLNSRFGKRNTTPNNSLYSMLTLDSESKWRSSFVAGMMFATCLVAGVFGFEEIGNTHIKPLESDRLFFQGTGLLYFIISGFLIGFGTRLAKGGLTRYAFFGVPKFGSKSMVATLTIVAFAIITATLRSSFSILQGFNLTKKFNEHLDFRLSFFIPLLIVGFNIYKNFQDSEALRDIGRSFGIGTLLSVGLMVSGLTRRHQVLDSLSLNKFFNPFLLFVVAGTFLGNLIFLNLFKSGSPTPIEETTSGATVRVLIGCALFGMGLGITGLTPASGLVVSPVYLPQIALFFLPFIVAGQMLGGTIDRTVSGVKSLKTN